MFTVSPADYFVMKLPAQALLMHFKPMGYIRFKGLESFITADIEEALHKFLLEKTNFWQNVFEILLKVTLMFVMCYLYFCGFIEKLSKDNMVNFLSTIQLLAKYDTALDKLLQLPKGSPKYLIHLIQNELISLLAVEVLHDIKSEIQSTLSEYQQKRLVK